MPYQKSNDEWQTPGVDFLMRYDPVSGHVVPEFRCGHGEWQFKCFRCIVSRARDRQMT